MFQNISNKAVLELDSYDTVQDLYYTIKESEATKVILSPKAHLELYFDIGSVIEYSVNTVLFIKSTPIVCKK